MTSTKCDDVITNWDSILVNWVHITTLRCGLVALSMAAEIAESVRRLPLQNGGLTADDKQPKDTDVGDLLCLAQKKGFTQHGDMFSAEDLAELSQLFYGLKSSVISNGLVDVEHVLSNLSEGNPVLVPYDAAKNHEPCVAQGHRAHWAVLTGKSRWRSVSLWWVVGEVLSSPLPLSTWEPDPVPD